MPGEAVRRVPGTHPSTRRKILQSVAAVAAWASLVGLGTFGTFSDPATPFTEIREDAAPR